MFWYMCGFSGRDNIGSSKKWKLVLEMSIIIHKYDTCKLKKKLLRSPYSAVLVLLTYSYSRMIVWCNNPLLYCRTFRKVWKSGWARSNVVAIICPLVWIGLTDLPKSGEGGIAPSVPPPGPYGPVVSRVSTYILFVSKLNEVELQTLSIFFRK